MQVSSSDLEQQSQGWPDGSRSAAARAARDAAAGFTGDPAALAQEIVRFVARSDIDEEVVRMRGHVEHWRALAAGPEPCGRKLDFLVQEMNREINTIGSKVEGRARDRDGHRRQGRARADARAGPECRVAAASPRAGSCSSCRRRRAPGRRRWSSGWCRCARTSSGRGRTLRGRPGRGSATASTIILSAAPRSTRWSPAASSSSGPTSSATCTAPAGATRKRGSSPASISCS